MNPLSTLKKYKFTAAGFVYKLCIFILKNEYFPYSRKRSLNVHWTYALNIYWTFSERLIIRSVNVYLHHQLNVFWTFAPDVQWTFSERLDKNVCSQTFIERSLNVCSEHLLNVQWTFGERQTYTERFASNVCWTFNERLLWHFWTFDPDLLSHIENAGSFYLWSLVLCFWLFKSLFTRYLRT